ncbi:MAG TPA: hypothetical protein VJ859_10000 [Allosphingosinicella sp.]|nr:hypothetical protein [Allosphingosinicella sp.]
MKTGKRIGRNRFRITIAAALIGFGTSAPVLAHVTMRSPAPAHIDAFTGITDRQTLAVGHGGPIARVGDLNVAVILSENTKAHLAWSKDMMAGLNGIDRAVGGFIAGKQAVIEGDRMLALAYDPKFITDSVMQPLVSRFRSVTVVGGMQDFTGGGYDAAILLDVSFVNTFHDSWVLVGNKYETGTAINAYLIDQRNTLLGQVEINETRKVPRDSFQKGVADVRYEVLAKYKTGLEQLLGPEPAALPAPGLAAPAEAPAEERLKAVDELLRKGLISPQEAAAKRAEILSRL